MKGKLNRVGISIFIRAGRTLFFSYVNRIYSQCSEMVLLVESITEGPLKINDFRKRYQNICAAIV